MLCLPRTIKALWRDSDVHTILEDKGHKDQGEVQGSPGDFSSGGGSGAAAVVGGWIGQSTGREKTWGWTAHMAEEAGPNAQGVGGAALKLL